MKIEIESNILRYYLRNVYFINGTAYAGKSTMVAMLAEKYGMIQCGENYHIAHSDAFVTPEYQPNLCYFQTMKDWQEFINRTPDEYASWIEGSSREAAQIEIAELLSIPDSQRVMWIPIFHCIYYTRYLIIIMWLLCCLRNRCRLISFLTEMMRINNLC